MPPLPVFDLDHPKIRVETALASDCLIYIALLPAGKFHPLPVAGHKIKRALHRNRPPIQRVEFDQNRARSVVAMRYDEALNILKPEPREVGLNPE